MKKVKDIALRFTAKGEGIVNYDDSSSKPNRDYFKIWNDNVKYAKKDWYYDEENKKMDYKIVISSDAIRSSIFNNHLKSPVISHHQKLLCDHFSNVNSLLRGWLFTVSGSLGFKRKSAVTIGKLVQTNNSKSVIQINTKRGEMEVKNIENPNDRKSKSLRYTETIGHIEYSGKGFIDIQQLQFLSLDDMFDRLGFNSDYFDTFKEMFKNKYGFDLTAKHYTMITEPTKFPEMGIRFNTEVLNLFVRHLLKIIYNFNIKRNTSYAYMDGLEYKVIYSDDSFNDSVNDERGWIKINNEVEIDSINFEYESYYEEADLNSISIVEEAKEFKKSNDNEEYERKEKKKELEKQRKINKKTKEDE